DRPPFSHGMRSSRRSNAERRTQRQYHLSSFICGWKFSTPSEFRIAERKTLCCISGRSWTHGLRTLGMDALRVAVALDDFENLGERLDHVPRIRIAARGVDDGRARRLTVLAVISAVDGNGVSENAHDRDGVNRDLVLFLAVV